MRPTILLLFLLSFIPSLMYAGEEPMIVPSNLRTVTVYRSGAELTHMTTAQLQKGSQDMVIEGISNTIDMNSVQINCPAAVTIMGIEFSHNFLVAPETSARINFLKDSVAKVQRELDKTSVEIQTTNDLLEVLKTNRDIKGQQTGLSVAELMKLMEYYKSKSTELQNELAALKERQNKLNELLAKIRNQIHEEESKNTRNAGQLRLQLSIAASGKYDFTISYISPNAWWSPSYDIRVDDVKNPMKIIYKAKLAQTTGIDWRKVKLSLSTSVPNQWGNAPVLKSWFLSYINPVTVMERNLANNHLQSFSDQAPASAAPSISVRGIGSLTTANQPLYIVNGVEMNAEDATKISSASIKSVEVLKDANATSLYGARATNGVVIITLKDGLEDYVSVSDNQLDVTYDIDLPYDLNTNGKEQTATLKEFGVSSSYKYYAVPRLDRDAYLIAEVADWEKLNLLPGDANIIFEGTYVGKSFIDPASTADTLNLTLGRDKRVIVKKEKLIDYSSTKFFGNNKLQKLSYEITVKNNKKDSVHMLLKDQYPLSTNKDVEVELLESSGAINNPELGILSWKLELAPGETKKLRFAYTVKYPKDKMLNVN
ncbi:MAG: mucoidy inhibitor MuiA family protein [Flavisolibacter sp.]